MKKYLICGVLFVAAVAAWEQTGRVRAQADFNTAAQDVNPPGAAETIVHIYDVRDLLKSVKNYPTAGGPLPLTQLDEAAVNANQPQQNGAPPQPQPPTRAQQDAADLSVRTTALQQMLLVRVDPNSWKENGGTVGSVDWFDGQFVVTQTAVNHRAIEKLLNDLRAARDRMVRVRADWLLLSPVEAETLLKNSGETSAVPEIARELLSALPGNTPHYTGSILCFSGQTVSICSGRTKSLVTGLSAVPGYEMFNMTPTVTYIQEGICLQVTPTVSGDSVTLDLASILAAPNKFVQHPTTQPAIDRVDSDLQHFHTTVQVPLNKPVLIAGTTADPNPQEPAGKQLYLIIEADCSPTGARQ